MATPQDEAIARTEVLLRDAEDALQNERMAEFWRQWGTTVIGMAVMLVIGTGAGVVWREWRQAQNEKATAALSALVTKKDFVVGPEVTKDLGPNHAAIAYLTKAGKLVEAGKTEGLQAELSKLYAAADKAGDDTVWGWLARLNTLRLRMDDGSADANALLKDYEKLAAEKKSSGFAALALADAAIVAGERLKDPAKALDYITQAEAAVERTSPMASTISDLKHLYQVRAQSTNAQPTNGDKAQ